MSSVDPKTVEGFGEEWQRFDQSGTAPGELDRYFDMYFDIFPWASLPTDAIGFDAGCGSGRWARLVAPRVGTLHCVDASDAALAVTRENLAHLKNVQFHHAPVDKMPFAEGSMDFGYSLGVLHHTPDTLESLRACVRHLKPGAPMLVYLYYAFDNRPRWFRAVWQASDLGRRVVSKLPTPVKHVAAEAIAASVYYPLARGARLAKRLGLPAENLPLSSYGDASFYTMRTDALDRFGTRLEHRFTRAEIDQMMRAVGLRDIRFREGEPYWCAVGVKA